MKRLFAILLVLCLVLCGCEAGGNMPTKPNTPGQTGGEQTANPTSGGNTVEPTRPAEVELIEVDGAALCVTVTINPMFELYLDLFNEILEVKAQNNDAQKLLADLQVVGKPYGEGITLILAEAEQQGFLQNRSKLSIETKELVDGGWNPRSEAMVLDPIEAYKAASGLAMTCDFYPAEKPLDEITSVHTNKRDGYKEEICYDIYDQHILTRMYFDDGSYWETDWVQKTSYCWNADGSYSYEDWKDGFSSSYTIYPDGTVDRVMRTVDKFGNRTDWELFLYADGSSWENFYDKSGNLTKSISANPDGSYSESFYENGELVRSFAEHPDGSSVEYFFENGVSVRATKRNIDGTSFEEQYYYENGEMVRLFATFSDGSTQEQFYENGQPVRTVITNADGSTREESGGNRVSTGTNPDGSTYEITCYPNGNIKTSNATWPDGDYQKQTYYENGNLETVISLEDGRYQEGYYDENGLMISLFQRDPDGTKYDWDYENGEAVGYTVTYPDGSTQIMSFGDGSAAGTNPDGSTYELSHYPNGNLKTNTTTWPNGDYSKQTYYENGNWETTIEFREGSYTEAYYDENGMLTSSFRREPDGTEYEYGYQNGSLKTSIITWSNGDYEHYTYYENGVFATQIGQSDGNYFENHYDENGLMTSSFERHSDGAEYNWDYENGEAVGYTVTYPDGSSEYHSYAP